MSPDAEALNGRPSESKKAESAGGAPAGNVNGDGKEGSDKGFGFGDGDLAALTAPPSFKSVGEERAYLKERLAAAFRIFAYLDMDHTVAGHLTVRDPEDHHLYWTNPFGLAFRLMTVSDLIQVNQEGKVIAGGKPGRRIVNLAGFLIHSGIHKTRPDVNAICHSHSIYGKAFSTLGQDLQINTQDACSFYNDIVTLKAFGGVVVKGEESALIAETLGKCKAIILQNHGILTVGTTIDSAVAWFVMLEQQCRVQLLAEAAAANGGGKPLTIDVPQAEMTYGETGHERAGFFLASPYFQVIEALQGHEYKQ